MSSCTSSKVPSWSARACPSAWSRIFRAFPGSELPWREKPITPARPMAMRRDAGHAAARVVTFLRDRVRNANTPTVATVGCMSFEPNAINVIPLASRLRRGSARSARAAAPGRGAALATYLKELTATEEVTISVERLARFEPVTFDRGIVELVEDAARKRGLASRRMTSGAGHDALMIARIAPSAMIFVPSVGGISHNPREHTAGADLVAGVNILLDVAAPRSPVGRHPVNLEKPWRKIWEMGQLPDVRLHDLHQPRSAPSMAGAAETKALLGHAQAATTARYAHLAADPLKEAVDVWLPDIAALSFLRLGVAAPSPRSALGRFADQTVTSGMCQSLTLSICHSLDCKLRLGKPSNAVPSFSPGKPSCSMSVCSRPT
jgi:hypothetical protein